MSMQRNFYEVLGVPQAATTDQIKKKYRELARTWHPDVVKDKDMGQRVFSQINQAYRVLGDAERRAQYNATLAATAASGHGTSGNGSSAASQAGQPSRPYGTANGTAQASRPSTNGTSAPSAGAAEQPVSAQKLEAIPGLLSHADNAIMAGKPIEAAEHCLKVLGIDPRNVKALDILGDALTQQGKREEAAAQYRKALQVAPSHSIQAKLNRLEQAPPSARPRPAETAPASGPGKPTNGAAKPSGSPMPPGKSIPAAAVADKAGGLFGRLLGRK